MTSEWEQYLTYALIGITEYQQLCKSGASQVAIANKMLSIIEHLIKAHFGGKEGGESNGQR